MANQVSSSAYGNESISALKGADRVRKRPGVIFGSAGLDGCQHAVFEILSNSIDEAKEGHGKRIIDGLYRPYHGVFAGLPPRRRIGGNGFCHRRDARALPDDGNRGASPRRQTVPR